MIRLRVKEVAEAKGVSMSRLSRISDVNYKTIQHIWRDPFREVSSKTIEKLAKALGVPSAELIEDVPDE
jgi:transcriptional regulator with XRE-family HTH domain